MMAPTEPVLARFLEIHPELSELTTEVLSAAERVRRARAAALPPLENPEIPSPIGPRLLEAMQGLSEAIDEGSNGPELAAAAHRVAREIARVRAASHRFAPARRSTSPTRRKDLFEALKAHQRAWARLTQRGNSLGVRSLPWPLELATHVEPGTPREELAVSGYDLPLTLVSQRHWGERCSITGRAWTLDRRDGSGERYRSLEAAFRTLAPDAHALVERLRSLLPALSKREPRAALKLQRVVPEVLHQRVQAHGSIRFERLGLLDFPSLAVSLNNALTLYSERPFFGFRDPEPAGEYRWMTYADFRLQALALARWLDAAGAAPGERLGLLLPRMTAEFHVADFAAVFGRLTSIALPATAPPGTLLRLLRELEIGFLVIDPDLLDTLSTIGPLPSTLREVLVASPSTPDTVSSPNADPSPLGKPLTSILEPPPDPDWRTASGIGLATSRIDGDAAGFSLADRLGIPRDGKDELYTIVFTSGSTGDPKGTPVTRRRWAEEMCSESDLWPLVGASFLAPWTAAERGSTWRAVTNGGRIGRARSGAALFEDLQRLRPTALDAPPVVWNALYAEYRAAIASPELTASQAAAARSRIRGRLGGRLHYASSGGAPSDPEVRRALSAVLETPLFDSYGSTETGNIAINGRLRPGLDYRLLPVPELGLEPLDAKTGRGELIVRTLRTTDHYAGERSGEGSHYTAEGYFRTGDLVEVSPNRELRHLGRRKQTFKLVGGSFLSPDEIEGVLTTSDLVEALFVAPGPTSAGLVAVVVPSRAETTEAQLLQEFQRLAQLPDRRPIPAPVAVVLETPPLGGDLPWTRENGLLTPSLKLNRLALLGRYGDAIAAAWTRHAERNRVAREALLAKAATETTAEEDRLRSLLAAILSTSPEIIDLRRSFFEHGGDSLTAMDWVLRLEEVFRLQIQDPAELVAQPLGRVLERIRSHEPGSPSISAASPPPATPETGTEVRPVFDDSVETTRSPPPLGSAPSSTPTATTPAATDTDPSTAVDIAALTAVDTDDIPVLKARSTSEVPSPGSSGSAIFVTGGTGFLGAHLLAELASSEPANRRIVALVRASSDETAAARLQTTLSKYALEGPEIGTRFDGAERIVVRAGTLSKPHFGLDHDAWSELERRVGMIYHVGAVVSSEATYSEVRPANVDGTRRVLELVSSGRDKALHFVSTRNVATLIALHHRRVAIETTPLPVRLTPTDVEANLPYAVSKWVGERMIERFQARARDQGVTLRVSVSRPALLAWSRATGMANDDDWMTRILRSCLELGSVLGPEPAGPLRWAPETETSARGLDLVPIDYAASAIVRLGRQTEAGTLAEPEAWSDQAPTYHLSNSAPQEKGLTTWARLMDLIVAEDLALSPISAGFDSLSPSDWMSRAEIEAAPILPVLRRLREHWPRYTRASTQRCEAAVGETCPPIDGTAVRRFLERYRPPAGP